MKLVKTDNPNYVIDKDTGLVINKNVAELQSYRKQVQSHLEIKELKDNFEIMRRELTELRQQLAKG